MIIKILLWAWVFVSAAAGFGLVVWGVRGLIEIAREWRVARTEEKRWAMDPVRKLRS